MGIQTEVSIPGLTYIQDYITPEDEAALLRVLDQQQWMDDLKRRVQHYGYRYDYKARNITTALRLEELPDWVFAYCQQLAAKKFFPAIPDQVIINEYQPGQGIAAHIDCIPCFQETIASLSLGSTCLMDFINSKTKKKLQLLLEPRSLIILSGEARYHWQHGIAHRKSDRYNGAVYPRTRRVSLTFRKVILAA